MSTHSAQRSLRPLTPRVWVDVLRGRSRTDWYFWLTLLFYLAICVMVYFAYVEPWIAGDISIRIGADSDRYWNSVKELRSGASMPLLSATGNLLGPVSVGLLLHNGVNVMVFNILLFLIAMKIASTIPDVRVGTFGFLLLLNFELIPSLTTLNKEIFALLSSVLIAKYLYAKKPGALALLGVLLVAAFSRWEEAAILILYLILRGIFGTHRKTALIALVGFLTIAFPVGLRVLGLDLSTFDWLMQGANTILVLNKIQYAYGFPLVVMPKIVMMMAGGMGFASVLPGEPGHCRRVHGSSTGDISAAGMYCADDCIRVCGLDPEDETEFAGWDVYCGDVGYDGSDSFYSTALSVWRVRDAVC